MDRYIDEAVSIIKEKVPEKEGIISLTSPSGGAAVQ
jgi:hypothetical protein